MSRADLSCPACGHSWAYSGDLDPDIAGAVCPQCGNATIIIEEDYPCDESPLPAPPSS
jgi:hypothetical protein